MKLLSLDSQENKKKRSKLCNISLQEVLRWQILNNNNRKSKVIIRGKLKGKKDL